MSKQLRITKVTRFIRIPEIVNDLRSDKTDEDLLVEYNLDWRQLTKIYSRLFFGGYLTEYDLIRRRQMRPGREASHIPHVQSVSSEKFFECQACGFMSEYHFTECPECGELNLRRLTRRAPYEKFMMARANRTA